LLERHASASIFHSPGWLSALRQTYGYEPCVVTTSAGTTLENGIVACRVKGWTSQRLVSLPFSDHCEPLVGKPEELEAMIGHLAAQARSGGWASIELRTRATDGPPVDRAAHGSGLDRAAEYCLHTLDLEGKPTEIFRRFHPSNTQRVIRRAEREGLTYEAGASDQLLASFYRLLRMTRRRHGLPPQPFAWFRNLVASCSSGLTIHVASRNGQPIASILTLSFKRTMFYKYGASDAAHHHLGGMPFLFWRVIQGACARGMATLDLGRSDLDQPGLIAFKDHLGASRSALTYYRYPTGRREFRSHGWIARLARRTFAHLPDAALDLAGRVLYKRFG
jgi:CelD/BcsL family acetyltransferase involved in cellulose biosynthesis